MIPIAQQGAPGGTITPPANNSGPNWLSAFSGVAGIWGIATEISITGPKPVNLSKANWANQVKAGMKFSRGLNTAGLALTAIDMVINGPDAFEQPGCVFWRSIFRGACGRGCRWGLLRR